ncbi:nitrite/sulfite reductase [Peribacillus castrilensis]|uniref:Ferredoxin--nitrite reductase n=1 Tax=Peribacillus simplex TaxID=1478 RepID=A0AAN2TSZ9_9BACI|nr:MULTISPECIES: ferredoxin--nitrite reductase [Peribacillus]MEA3573431.1 nitrite/sulfite reductase [Peribacillus frigoritolerans]NCT38136.1 nitrite/sulfite reductase [Peribacillus frigoritolerans]CEG32770.1 ferredoxin--nitrite reductase [Peribacillus simplex]
MVYEKFWSENPLIAKNKTEIWKLEKDGLKIFDDIPHYAANGFDSIPKEKWDMFKWAGLYLQRPKEAGYWMMRVVIPGGILTYDQQITLANIAKDYGRDVYDITTRQAIQFHWLTIEQVPDILNRLEKVGMTTAGACGDITRNIIGNALAGIDPDELFDTREVLYDVFEYFRLNEDYSNLPRKYKMSISANIHNASNAEINCVSFNPATKVMDGVTEVGFHVKVGGGLSSVPMLAEELDLFILPEKTVEVAAAITTIFRDFGYREKRHRSRLKFLVADWGPEQFKEKLLEYTGPLPDKGESAVKGWNAGYFYGIHKQKQDGLNYVGVNIPVGRLNPDEVIEFAELAKKYGNGEIRNCNSQNLIIPNVPDAKLEELKQESIFERFPYQPKKFIGYSVSCTGIEYCNLALVETKNRMRTISESLDKEIDLDVPVRMHMVGCPNNCGQRAIAEIGLQGIKMKNQDKKMVEAFEIYVGGTLNEGGKFNEKLKGKVEAEKLHHVLKEMILFFKETKLQSETFLDFVERVGVDELQSKLDDILAEVAV